MSRRGLAQVLDHIRRRSTVPSDDRALLVRYTTDRDEAAFTELVRRHGPLVWGVARRVLGLVHDTEDVFQATFLVLARKAAAVPWRESIGGWLHGVAFRLARKARSEAARRSARLRELAQLAPAEPSADLAWRELRQVLDEELQRLPARYRDVLLLCYLEGRTRDEAAERLGYFGRCRQGPAGARPADAAPRRPTNTRKTERRTFGKRRPS